jgi:hypothetical protein
LGRSQDQGFDSDADAIGHGGREVTIEDPKVLTTAWTSPLQTYSLAHED